MKDKRIAINKLYNTIARENKVINNLKKELINEESFDKNFIVKNFLPLAKKIDPKITWKDILDYEKDSFLTPLTTDELSNVSGGKTSNIILNCGLLALMGLSGVTNNIASAQFIKFEETKEYREAKKAKDKKDEAMIYVKLGDIPFIYKQITLLTEFYGSNIQQKTKLFFS